MPRRRGRSRPRLSRMDAAVDAMRELGFAEGKVKKKVKELLKEYGGDDCWPFIEESSYKVLLDSFLDEADDEDEEAQNGNLLEDESCGKEEAGGSSSVAQKGIAKPDITEFSASAAETVPLPATSLPLQGSTSSGVAAAHRRRRTHCYGWIDNDKDDDVNDFIDLAPMTVQGRATLDVITWKKKRRSRWDVKPGDP